jgi:hypothetical protein
MEQKPKKICNLKELKVGYRYTLSRYELPGFSFIVTLVGASGFVYVKYSDGIKGILSDALNLSIFEHPLSSLEKELL